MSPIFTLLELAPGLHATLAAGAAVVVAPAAAAAVVAGAAVVLAVLLLLLLHPATSAAAAIPTTRARRVDAMKAPPCSPVRCEHRPPWTTTTRSPRGSTRHACSRRASRTGRRRSRRGRSSPRSTGR